ncbi:hypothetical protein LB450_05005 [Psychroflexus sp. CAK1W]|uniref:hypothetical protein n=1 Tax=Psychroflexus curvus TaxID=2873595 RepID=UPI001CCFE86F|nr:hypothetical protein [Psychroflexus curvus]MBZ9627452.1 hypothetical protein [Psychroflexus curvus]
MKTEVVDLTSIRVMKMLLPEEVYIAKGGLGLVVNSEEVKIAAFLVSWRIIERNSF